MDGAIHEANSMPNIQKYEFGLSSKFGQSSADWSFSYYADSPVGSGPLELVWCPDSGLLQLGHSFEPTEMYRQNYGYQSGLNQSMVNHLTNKIYQLRTDLLSWRPATSFSTSGAMMRQR